MDSTTDNTESQDAYPNAGRDSGYVAPVGEDLVNKLTTLLTTMETKLLTSNIALRAEIEAQGNIRRSQFRELQEQTDDRHDAIVGELKQVLAVSEATADGLKKLSLQVGDQGQALAAVIGDVSDLKEGQADIVGQVGTLTDRVLIIEQTPGTYPDLLQGMQHLERMVVAIGQKNDERQKMNNRRLTYLVVGFDLLVLLLVVATLIRQSAQ